MICCVMYHKKFKATKTGIKGRANFPLHPWKKGIPDHRCSGHLSRTSWGQESSQLANMNDKRPEKHNREIVSLSLPSVTSPSLPVSCQFLLNIFFQLGNPPLDLANQPHSHWMKRDGHPPCIKFTKKLLLLKEAVCSDRYLLEYFQLGWHEFRPPRGNHL